MNITKRRLAFGLLAFLAGATIAQQTVTHAAAPKSPDLEALRCRGLRIIGAVVTEDVATLLEFDRPDLRGRDSRALANPSSPLSCFLFNERCVQKGSRTVRQSLVMPSKLKLAVHMPTNQKPGAVYAALVFYDGSHGEIPPKELCDSGLVRETWTFEWTGTDWVSAGPMFDDETEGWCGYNPTV